MSWTSGVSVVLLMIAGCGSSEGADAPPPMDAGADSSEVADAELDAAFDAPMDAPRDVGADAIDAAQADTEDPCAGIDCTRAFCDGPFACAGGECVRVGPRPTCDDGIGCTFDRCDRALDACFSERGPACDPDAGVGTDASVRPCGPFAPSDVEGIFAVYPPQSLDCVESYSIDELSFAATGMLTVTGAPAAMIGDLPPGGLFSVTGSTACGTYTLEGRFVCADRFEGTLTTSFAGECAICGGGRAVIVGLR